ncbi:MAG: hypothetical protein LBB61_03725 [Treponema sp.]|jgi:hypothetical protein|nr:hypothetical protein [Treponema sp.]
MSNDVCSAPEAEFLSFAAAFNAGLVTHAEPPGIPPSLVSANTAKLAAYASAYHAAEAPNAGKLDREDRGEKREDLIAGIRKIKNAYTDGSRRMSLPARSVRISACPSEIPPMPMSRTPPAPIAAKPAEARPRAAKN